MKNHIMTQISSGTDIEKLVEKHRNNMSKYRHLLNQPVKDKSSNPQDTLSRIESKFGISLSKKQADEEEKRLSESRVVTDEKIKIWIQEIRNKYRPTETTSSLTSKEATPIASPKNDIENDHLIDFTPVKAPLIDLTPTKHEKETTPTSSPNKTLLELEGLEIPPIKQKVEKYIDYSKEINDSPFDGALSIEDLVSEPGEFQSPSSNLIPKLDLSGSAHKPPRKKSLDTSDSHIQPISDRDEHNRSFNENSMSMSFRRANAEHMISKAISDIITKNLGISLHRASKKAEKPVEKSPILSFDQFLADASREVQTIPTKIPSRFSPIVKTVNIDKIYQEDSILQQLTSREKSILIELQELEKEKAKLLSML
ncbi:unnamed protein product [Blepharisma stoltei]|uniref:Homeobox domain-containing protein n=1 Tax=Blepharisma stoltei TaxID=1481888 RepID=A0AAU9I647_9CILI|nr:unnamed protein product [Blepharisma stoltei]